MMTPPRVALFGNTAAFMSALANLAAAVAVDVERLEGAFASIQRPTEDVNKQIEAIKAKMLKADQFKEVSFRRRVGRPAVTNMARGRNKSMVSILWEEETPNRAANP